MLLLFVLFEKLLKLLIIYKSRFKIKKFHHLKGVTPRRPRTTLHQNPLLSSHSLVGSRQWNSSAARSTRDRQSTTRTLRASASTLSRPLEVCPLYVLPAFSRRMSPDDYLQSLGPSMISGVTKLSRTFEG